MRRWPTELSLASRLVPPGSPSLGEGRGKRLLTPVTRGAKYAHARGPTWPANRQMDMPETRGADQSATTARCGLIAVRGFMARRSTGRNDCVMPRPVHGATAQAQPGAVHPREADTEPVPATGAQLGGRRDHSVGVVVDPDHDPAVGGERSGLVAHPATDVE